MYQFNSITTVDDCNAALAQASKIKGNLLYRKASLQMQIENFSNSEDDVEVQNEIQACIAQIDGFNTAKALTTVGSSDWNKLEQDVNKLEKRMRALQEKLGKNPPEEQLKRQNAMTYLDEQLAEADIWITGLQTRLTDLNTGSQAA